jgi:TonB family protein
MKQILLFLCALMMLPPHVMGQGIALGLIPNGTRGPIELETGRIFTGSEVDVKPRLLKKSEPSYTEKARAEGIAGTVVLRVVLSATGKVTNIRVVSGLPHGLTKRAVDAARKIKFVPAMKDGKSVSMWMQLEYDFSLTR